MTVAVETALMNTEQLLALPEDGLDRDLIRGRLRERPMTRRNPRHSNSEARIVHVLATWLEQKTAPKGRLFSGEVGVRIRKAPDTTVGIDVAYFAAADVATAFDAALVDAVPVLAVEILSPSDRQEDILDKVEDYLAAGVKQVWVVEPVFRTVTVYRPGAEPAFYTASQRLAGDPDLPGFSVAVGEFFDD
jgi:Uma2 family endonuclease